MIALLLAALVQASEPQEYWTGPIRGETPVALQGAAVIDGESLDRLIAADHPLLVDVSPEDKRPPDVTVWLPTHRSIPGSVWLPGAGQGVLDAWRIALLERIGDRVRPVVVFCHPRCWASWNAAKRLVRAGYRRVLWYRDGIEGWQDRHATAVVTPDSGWVRATAAAAARPAYSAEKE